MADETEILDFTLGRYVVHNPLFFNATLRKMDAALIVVCLMLFWWQTAVAQQDSNALQLRNTEFEVQKLECELVKLKEEPVGWDKWLTPFQTFFAGIFAGLVSFWVARRGRAGALDQATHEKRLEYYPQLVKATSLLALYFPKRGTAGTASLDPHDCWAMGCALSEWYFGGGGLLMSVEARDAYFQLARALTRASSAKALRVPTFPNDAEAISNKKVDEYRSMLKNFHLDDVENWMFGGGPSGTEQPVREPHLAFQDYVFLQRLSSKLRTKLSEDLRSRRRPV